MRIADITGQSLPTLEDSDFAWFDNACSLCHFPLPCTSLKQLDVNCDVVFFCAVLARLNTIRLSAGDAV